MLNLDTHILVALLKGELSDEERSLILSAQLAISDIVLWEIAKLVQLGRLHGEIERTWIVQETDLCVTGGRSKWRATVRPASPTRKQGACLMGSCPWNDPDTDIINHNGKREFLRNQAASGV